MPKATVVITADNQLKKGIDPAKKAILELQGIASKLDRQISKGLSIAGMAATAVASWKLITGAAKECINAYAEAEKVSLRLEAVWKNVGASTNRWTHSRRHSRSRHTSLPSPSRRRGFFSPPRNH